MEILERIDTLTAKSEAAAVPRTEKELNMIQTRNGAVVKTGKGPEIVGGQNHETENLDLKTECPDLKIEGPGQEIESLSPKIENPDLGIVDLDPEK